MRVRERETMPRGGLPSIAIAILLAGCATGSIGRSRYCGPAAASGDFGEREITVSGVRLHVHEAGRGNPPIVLVHGFGGTTFTWRKLVGPLSGSQRVITFDLPGHGYSDKPKRFDYGIESLGAFTYELLRSEGLEGVVLVGNSIGGAIALAALHHAMETEGAEQTRVAKLCLIDSAGYPQKLPPEVKLLKMPLVKHLVSLLPSRWVTRKSLQSGYADAARIEPEQVGEYANALKTPGNRRAMRQCVAAIIPEDFEAYVTRYRSIRVPTLLIWGEKDTTVPIEVARRFDADIPNSRLAIVKEAAHVPQEEQPEEVLRLLEELLHEAP